MKHTYLCALVILLLPALARSQTREAPQGDGIRVEIVQPYNLWYFPTVLPAGYHVSDVARAYVEPPGLDKHGTFKWEVVGSKGFGALGLVPSGERGLVQTVTKTDDKYVNIYTKGYSDAEGDVTLRLTYTPPGASFPARMDEKTLTVRTVRLVIESDEQYIPGAGGSWECRRGMKATDQFGINAIPTAIDINEFFAGWKSLYSGENWQAPAPWPLADAIEWCDRVNPGASSTIPLPVHRSGSGDSTPVDEAQQTWRYGSMTVGSGDAFLDGEVNWRRNRGYAEHTN